MKGFSFFIAGDFCPIGRNEKCFSNQDFKAVEAIKPSIDDVDFSIVNLEAPLTTSDYKIKKSGPNIKANPKTIAALQYLGIDLVTLANNHILDFGEKGVEDTLQICQQEQIKTVGAGSNLQEAQQPFSIEINGKKIALLNFAENEFCAAKKNSAGANPQNEIANFHAIKTAKKNNDLVVVIQHGGREHYQLPTPQQQQRYRFYAEVGADIVIGHHTHCYSGYEIYHQVPIFYSLGNFIFDYKKKYQQGKWTEGFAVVFSVEDQITFEIIPFFQGRSDHPSLVLMEGVDKENFFKNIEKLNAIIANEDDLQTAWQDYLATQSANYKSMMTVQNKYLRAAIAKKYLPYLPIHNKAHLLLLLNMLRCETHREIASEVLSKYLEDEK